VPICSAGPPRDETTKSAGFQVTYRYHLPGGPVDPNAPMTLVVGYDDSSLSRLAHVNLTTVSQDGDRVWSGDFRTQAT